MQFKICVNATPVKSSPIFNI